MNALPLSAHMTLLAMARPAAITHKMGKQDRAELRASAVKRLAEAGIAADTRNSFLRAVPLRGKATIYVPQALVIRGTDIEFILDTGIVRSGRSYAVLPSLRIANGVPRIDGSGLVTAFDIRSPGGVRMSRDMPGDFSQISDTNLPGWTFSISTMP